MKDFIYNLFADTKIDNPLTDKTFAALATRIAGYFYMIAVPVSIIMILWGAFQMLTAAGEPEKIQTARKTIIWALVGLGIAMIAAGLLALIKELLGAK